MMRNPSSLLLALALPFLFLEGLTGKECPPHSHHSECGAECQRTCADQQLKICPLICSPGCICNKGYIREFKSGPCIPQEQCSCPANSHYTECGPGCVRTCKNCFTEHLPCPDVCFKGCVCDEGYVHETENGPCILKSQCPCPPHSHYTQCEAHCEKTCATRNDKSNFCPRICWEGCKCNPGYVRDKGICIPKHQCHCPPHSHHSECGFHCRRTCANRHEKKTACSDVCHAGCVCDKGYYQKGKFCVRKRFC
ncbi:alpha-tectorin-like [Rhinatrema bivittatum]|uniref:alpha-tectorin-like n=1 Tax=Rhinatrema bivittatum TaxID=194408 RepID=UPI00112813F7|nr:alpha-tectorin-like [Rhinatrema bivittatum]